MVVVTIEDERRPSIAITSRAQELCGNLRKCACCGTPLATNCRRRRLARHGQLETCEEAREASVREIELCESSHPHDTLTASPAFNAFQDDVRDDVSVDPHNELTRARRSDHGAESADR
jgi:hypothetical protein